MGFSAQKSFHIGEPGEIACARRAGLHLAQQLGFSDVRKGQLALVITEAATNIAKHAQRGEILIRSLERDQLLGVEIIAIDRGPGIGDIATQMEDGNSTTGTYGGGLGAISRLSQEFEIYSVDGQGTVLMMSVWADQAPVGDEWQVGVVCLPFPGEDQCGDAWSIDTLGHDLNLLVADGLGHGPEAAKAANAAIAVMPQHENTSPGGILQCIHLSLRGTRGAAVAIAQISRERHQVGFAGVGNITVSIFDHNACRQLLSHNGIVGHNMRKLQELSYHWPREGLLIAHSDGMGTRWDLQAYPGLAESHPTLIAAVLYRDFNRGRDDVTVVVVREMRGQDYA